MKLIYFIKFLKRYVSYKMSSTKRYSELLLKATSIKAKNFLEIGVYTGKRSKELIECGKIFRKKINYYGFDLFEDITDKKIKKELSKKPDAINAIKTKLSKLNLNFFLIKGNTINTLKKFKPKILFDLIFIDGGHSIKTIESDWKYTKRLIKKNGFVVFDDYYVNDKKIIKKFGCNNLINHLKKKGLYSIEFSKNTDYFPGKNYGIKLVFVKILY
jgi:hypothetical protein